MRRLLVLASLMLVLLPFAASTQAQDAPLRVAIKPLVPFVIYGANDQYSGFSIDLWAAIATRLDRAYEFVPFNTVEEVINAVETGAADVGIAGISITREREEVIDFSQPMFNAGLQIMTRAGGSSNLLSGLLTILTPSLLALLVILIIVIILIAHVVWWVERRSNDAFPDAYLPGVGEGIWWAVASMVGSGDTVPHTVAGRIAHILWTIVGIVLISLFTANITAQSTIQQLEGTIRGVADLPGNRVMTVADTTAVQYLIEARLPFSTVTTIEEAYVALEDNQADAIVYDAPVLRYYASGEGQGQVQLVGGLFERQDYGIALTQDSPYREQIDRALLALVEEDVYGELYARWFGET
jgi:polar amino acid transport system substrate-binding protein